jgi:MYXO-CTERM domain-containing protein
MSDAGCGCAVGGTSSGLAGVALALGAALARRRR